MYGFYRKSNAFNPEIFAVGAEAVLAEYPLDVVDLCCDVRTGMPSHIKYPPEVKDIRDFCNAIMERRQRVQDRQASLRAQFAEREAYERELAERASHPTKADLERSLGRPLGERQPIPALPPDRLWARWIVQREMAGVTLHPDARAVLEAAGYDIDGPDDQEPYRVPGVTGQTSAANPAKETGA